MIYQEMLVALTEENASRRLCWYEHAYVLRQGKDLIMHYPNKMLRDAVYEPDEDWGGDPGDEKATDWVIVEHPCP